MKNKIRLYIEYAVLALLLAVVGLAVTLKMQTYRQEISINNLSDGLKRAEGEIKVITSVNEAQESVIQTLGNQRMKDNQIVDQLMDTYDKLREADLNLRSKLDNLEKTDAEAQVYLVSPVPESVACLYDDSCPTSNDSKNRVPKADSTLGPVTSLLLAPEEKAKGGKGDD